MPISPHRRAEELSKQEKVEYVKSQGQTRDHHCHWSGCGKNVPPAMWGCYKHWMMLPKYLRDKIWTTFRPGQETNWTPSRDYLSAAQEVENWIIANHMPCIACNNTGVNSKGGVCIPCQRAGRIK